MNLDHIFMGCAGFGGALFLVQMVLQFLGHDSSDGGISTDHDVSGTADVSFKLLSFQGLTAFFMMFGLVGLAMHRQSGAAPALSAGVGAAAGLLAVWVIGRLFSGLKKLQSSGTMDVRNAVGQEGEVYLTIPPGGTGQVRVRVQNQLRTMDAATSGGEPIKTGARVRVVSTSVAGVLMVEKI